MYPHPAQEKKERKKERKKKDKILPPLLSPSCEDLFKTLQNLKGLHVL
jgi:hypothetical protein